MSKIYERTQTPVSQGINSLPNNKISDWSKLKAIADNKIEVVKMMTFFLDRVESTVGKGENSECFHRAFYPGSSKVGIVW